MKGYGGNCLSRQDSSPQPLSHLLHKQQCTTHNVQLRTWPQIQGNFNVSYGSFDISQRREHLKKTEKQEIHHKSDKRYIKKKIMDLKLSWIAVWQGRGGGIFYMFTSALLIQPSGLSGLSLIIVEKSWIAASAFSLCWKEIITFLIQNRINFLESNKDVQSWGYSKAQVNTRYINKELTCRPFCT